MTTIYRPVKTGTAEQAEALPAGTVAFHGSEAGRSTAWRIPPITALGGEGSGGSTFPGRVTHASMVGWTALVPIEAEEERSERAIAEGEFIGTIRLVTPWEEA